MKAYDHLAMQCRLLYERMAEVNDSKACPSDLVGVVGTIVYAAEVLLDLPGSEQLVEVRRQLGLKFGEKFSLVAVYQPKRYEVFDVIERIAVENKILWLRPVDSKRPPDMSARVRASIYNSAGSPSLVAGDLPDDGKSETITYRRSIVKQSNALISMGTKPRLHHASLRLYPHI
ncbi:hypothetical protein Pmar_PMAR027373 [Perkinsus marinus ATCC 50983]|uniref:Uncharacterized protein n=1 Tax=Perkinsus marinus (strain ATCC 50983 / TXsc) TaxID=423536 RepID=C5LKK4_PERM5|nr:hypothetical protein Pmar_PMAR027373 [Perkinsus marinus ATCC 50983]EER02739.1 hypothetical protein Pmar_PMAR027373 [Perkinsus marinus ATCC 50983]|eukprot:XP_002770923.1 hypothetical protein Pmar_PMAR027373 [Perkinsus marinus ATCC 50983]